MPHKLRTAETETMEAWSYGYRFSSFGLIHQILIGNLNILDHFTVRADKSSLESQCKKEKTKKTHKMLVNITLALEI